MMETIRPLPVISTVQVVNKLFEWGHYETDENLWTNHDNTRSERIEDFIGKLKEQNGVIEEFDPWLWACMVDFVTVGRRKARMTHFSSARNWFRDNSMALLVYTRHRRDIMWMIPMWRNSTRDSPQRRSWNFRDRLSERDQSSSLPANASAARSLFMLRYRLQARIWISRWSGRQRRWSSRWAFDQSSGNLMISKNPESFSRHYLWFINQLPCHMLRNEFKALYSRQSIFQFFL